jgi:hypothetical protein
MTAALCGVAGLLLPVAPGLGQPSAAPPAQSAADIPAVGAAPAASGATDRGTDADAVEAGPAAAAAAELPPINVTVDVGGPVGAGAPTAGVAAAPPVGTGTAASSAAPSAGGPADPPALPGAYVAVPDTTRAEPRAEEVDRLRKEISRLQRRLAELESGGGRSGTAPARNGARFRGQEPLPQTSSQAGPARTPAVTRGQPAPESGVFLSRAAEGLRNGGSARSRPVADGDALDDIERDLQQMLERVRAMKGTPGSAGRQ